MIAAVNAPIIIWLPNLLPSSVSNIRPKSSLESRSVDLDLDFRFVKDHFGKRTLYVFYINILGVDAKSEIKILSSTSDTGLAFLKCLARVKI